MQFRIHLHGIVTGLYGARILRSSSLPRYTLTIEENPALLQSFFKCLRKTASNSTSVRESLDPYVLTLDSILLESEQAVQKKDSFGSSMFFNALSHQHFSWQSAGYAKALLNLPSQEVQQPPISGSQVPKSPHWQRSSL